MLQAPWACLAQHRITIFYWAQFLSFVPQPTLFLFLKTCTKKPRKQFSFIQAFLYWVEKWAISEAFEHYIWSSNFWIGPCLFFNRSDSGAMIFRFPPPLPAIPRMILRGGLMAVKIRAKRFQPHLSWHGLRPEL
jgi:hypothetical protein